MLKGIALFTVPHTGTHFAMSLLELVDLHKKNNTNDPMHDLYFQTHAPRFLTNIPSYLSTCKVIVMARDPYLGAFRWLPRNNTPIDDIADRWDIFLDILPTLDHYVIDVGCLEKKRYEHLCGAIQHIGYDPEQYSEQIGQYAKEWKPNNTSDNEYKKKYLETGELPSNYDYSRLRRAAAWYRKLPTN